MTRSLLAALLAGALLCGAARAAPAPLTQVQARRSRGLLSITAAGTTTATTPLVARLRSGTRTALETPVTVTNGALEVELLTTRALLPGEYVLEVGEAGKPPLLEAPLVVGDAAEAKASAARMDAWYRGAAAALRDLAASLDRSARYHRALVEDAPVHRERLERFLEGWSSALRAARMDLSNLERRLLLPPRPDVVAALLRVVVVLDERSRAWLEGMHSRGAMPSSAPIDSAADALVRSLGTPEEEVGEQLTAWNGGGLAVPPPGSLERSGPFAVAQAGVYTDGDAGFTVELPPGWTPFGEDFKPEERLRLTSPDKQASFLVEVQPLPDARTPEQLAAAVETLNWEGYLAYKPLERAPIVEGGVQVGVRIVFEADMRTGDRARVRAVQTSRWPASGGQIVHALVVRHAGAAPAADGLEALVERSFRPL